LNASLAWDCFDPDNDPLLYDLYFGENNPPELLFENIPENMLIISDVTLPGTTYFWKIVAKDGTFQTEGPVWSFSTSDE
jgi:hypothetical protein